MVEGVTATISRTPAACGERAGHYGRRNEGSSPARNVDADALERIESLADDRTLLVFHEPGLAQTAFCERANIGSCRTNCLSNILGQLRAGCAELRRSDPKPRGIQTRTAKFFGETNDGFIAIAGNGFKDFRHSLAHLRIRR